MLRIGTVLGLATDEFSELHKNTSTDKCANGVLCLGENIKQQVDRQSDKSTSEKKHTHVQ